jgi:peroxiredoxin
MKPRLNANGWVLIVLLGILLVIAVDVGRTYLFPPGQAQALAEARRSLEPEFKVGDPAPDFTLKDVSGKSHTLSKSVKGDTMLFFACGCANCRAMQTYLGRLQRQVGDRFPEVVSVTTMVPEAEVAYRRDTKLDQTILYEERNGPIMEQYKGHPCPRMFRVDGSRKVTWIGRSPAEERQIPVLAYEMAETLGFQSPREKGSDPKKPKAPVMVFDPPAPGPPGVPVPQGPTPAEATRPIPDAYKAGNGPAQGPGDGHAHGPGDGHGH